MFKLIMGLGNPGTRYKDTYHNIGKIFIDSLADPPWKRVSRKHFVYTEKDGVILIKSTLFMNESGVSASEALSYFKTIPSAFAVVHDDSDFFWGSHKLVFGRGPAGHKGVESIIHNLHTKNFWRLRIGVREQDETIEPNPASPLLHQAKAGDFVLKKITKKHRGGLADLFARMEREINQLP